MIQQIKIKIYGRVQGVFFRYTAKQKADELGIRGFARNLDDGSVEIIAQAEEENLNQFIEWVKTGPDLAKVEKIKVSHGTSQEEFSDFRIE